MIRPAIGWRLFAAEVRAHRDTRAAYTALAGRYRQILDGLTAYEHQETALQELLTALEAERDDARREGAEHVADLEHHLELMAIDNAELERTLDAMTQGLNWHEGMSK